jgi:Dodecin
MRYAALDCWVSRTGGLVMSVAKVIETTTSTKSFEDAIEKGIARADKTLKNVEGVDQGAESHRDRRQDQGLPSTCW